MQGNDRDVKPAYQTDLARGLLRGTCVFLAVDAVALILGLAVFLIAHGTMMGLMRLAPYWEPTSKFFGRAVPSIGAVRLPARGYQLFRLIIFAALMIIEIGFGIWLLVAKGFCGQNLICLVARH
jgi:hypothetical protein